MSNDPNRMSYHLMPPQGWLNDPNGLCWFQGAYHVFFQYSPDTPLGGDKHWGHYTSRDLLHWQFAGIAFSPDRPFDRHGVYSGSALVERQPDGQERMRIYYTGNVKLEGDYDYIETGREACVVYTDSTDGIHFSEKQVLMGPGDYPKDYTLHIRDPKVFTADGQYWMVLGGRKRGETRADDRGAVLCYTSDDGMDWKLAGELETKEPFGYMWECPDLFQMAGKWCFSFCPQGLPEEPHRYQNTDQSGYVMLEQDAEIARNFEEWDMGFDFYAPQTFEDAKGRRLLIGWVGLPEAPYTNPTVEQGWQHCLTVPRELEYRNGKMLQKPAAELVQLKEERRTWMGDGTVETEDFSFSLEMEEMDTESWKMTFDDRMVLCYDKNRQEFFWEFAPGGAGAADWGSGRRMRSMKLERLEQIQILCDHSVLEVFVNGGERVMCGRFYPDAKRCKITIQGSGAAAKSRYCHMKAMEVEGI